jgi:hypothetical protein
MQRNCTLLGGQNSEFCYISATTKKGNHEVYMDFGGIGEEETEEKEEEEQK